MLYNTLQERLTKQSVIRSKRLYSAQEYIERVTGKHYYKVSSLDEIEDIVGEQLWNYPLTEIDHIIENKIKVVLVMFRNWNENKKEFEDVLRWCEVPDDFKG